MATGFSRTLEKGHDAEYDYCCTPCTEDKLNAEASFYCRNCCKLFCDACIKFHIKFTKGHQVLGKDEVPKWGQVKSVTPAVMCEEHPGKEEEMYCADHDRTCCHICTNLYHKTCKNVSHVSLVAKGIQETPEFQCFLTSAARIRTRLINTLTKRAKNTKLLQETRTEITSSFKEIRQSFNQFIDNVEKESTAEMDRLLSVLQEKTQSDTEACSDVNNEIQKLLDDIKHLGNRCEEFAFQCFKRCTGKLFTAEEVLLSMKDNKYQMKFTLDPSIQQFQSSLKTFGKIDITPMKSSPDYVYTVDKIQQYNVRKKTDIEKCSLTGMCQLPSGQIVVVDNNKKIKLLSSSKYCVTAELDLPPYPYDICNTTGNELVVTVWSGSKGNMIRSELHFINAANGRLKCIQTNQLDHRCSGIACHEGLLYVSSNTAVYEYSLSGQKLRKIYEDTSDEAGTVYRLAVSDDGNRIFITKPLQHCFLTLYKSGKQLSVLRHPELQKPIGVCVADSGAVFVCGENPDTVIQVDSLGREKMVTLAKQSDGIARPRSLCYDRKLQQLVIGQSENDNLIVLKLK